MNIEEIIKLIDVLAWPVTAIVIIFLIKGNLPALMDRMKKLKVGALEAEFKDGLKELEIIADSPSKESSAYLYDSKAIQLQRVAELSPNGAVVDAWREVELASISAALHNELAVRGPKGRVAGNAAVRELMQNEIINEKMAAIYKQLKELRNKAAHHQGEISSSEAKEYTLAALELAGQFREIKKKI